MAAPTENKRTGSIRVRLSPEMMDRFESLSKSYGMPPATLCAFAVAQFVQTEENKTRLTRMAVLNASRHHNESVDSFLTDENMQRIFGGMLPGLQAAMQSQSIPLDDDASEGA